MIVISLKKEETQMNEFERACEAYRILSKGLNNVTQKEFTNGFIESLLKDHRTLQALCIRLIQKIIIAYALRATSDLRNEDAVKWCIVAKEATEGMTTSSI